ncbi:hypothetical protein EDD80_102290 [Anseongella ginsenosidimutans]|uniref:Uncharacterized protein n=1 Tax=Anseongella ginsenosidimutans TaxID=496056 RepID=A0A4R3KUK4_9SPHI|nr:hypothetical protein [Anseongella ginsenosidimutans]QEC51734.1 hypothetical protein FRZ59_04865 [Anseongella ginsenosidimutans]TCS89097.1 hypothetical protein EDD80_102290 [Anseongella ginsenosidimutans]
MQKIPGFRAIDQFSFNGSECFLSGLPASEKLSVFPDWLLDRYGLRDKTFNLLDERVAAYGGLYVPCHPVVKSAAERLEDQVMRAFEEGYRGLKTLHEHELFLWTGKLVMSLIYREFETAAALQPAGAALDVAPSLLAKLNNLQLLMQSLFRPVELDRFTPWTMILVEMEAPGPEKEDFRYNDEVNTLIFSMEARGAGLISCLQDNGENKRYHQGLLERIEGKKLQPIQFAELCARFYYSAYLFNRVPQYLVYPPGNADEAITIESMPLQTGAATGALFDNWDNKVYAQVLETFWKPWNISRFEILKTPENPLSYILDQEGNFIKKCVPPGDDTHN